MATLKEGEMWRHVTLATYGSWLPGDPRGFRTRHHKLHSSGDYHQPPPDGEHAGLHRFARDRVGAAVRLSGESRRGIGEAMVQALHHHGRVVLALAIAAQHAHFLAALSGDATEVKRQVGRVKSWSSRAVSDRVPGRLWAGGGSYKPITDQAHHRRVYQYILDHAREDAWVWCYRDNE